MLFQASRVVVATLLVSVTALSAEAALPIIKPSQTVPSTSGDGPNDQFSNFGSDVDMYGDVAIVGAPWASPAGRAAIFVRDASGHWTRTANLVATDATQTEEFGTRVALLNGKAVVASRTAIYLFVRQSSGTWQQKDVRTFKGADSVRDLDWQGNLLVVGVLGTSYPQDEYPNYAFAYDTSQTNTLRKIARFAPADAAHADGFGMRVAAYGSTAVVTAPASNNGVGAAYVYNCGTSSCTQTQKINPIDGVGGDFGSAVDMNGTYLVIGADGADRSGEGYTSHIGSVYVFTRSGTAWAQTQTLHPTSDEVDYYDDFGADVTIQGSRLLVSSPYNVVYESGILSQQGLVFEYVLNGSQWSAGALLKSPLSGFGASTSLIGKYAIVGAPIVQNPHGLSEVDFYTLP